MHARVNEYPIAPIAAQLAASCLLRSNGSRPNVVFVPVDDLRWDELGCTGHPFASTPHANRVAREGANFRNAFASTPLCSPSRAAFLTGTYSHTNGIIDNVARDAQSHRLVTWPLLHDAGYRTAFMGNWHKGNDDSNSYSPACSVSATVPAREHAVTICAECRCRCLRFDFGRGQSPKFIPWTPVLVKA